MRYYLETRQSAPNSDLLTVTECHSREEARVLSARLGPTTAIWEQRTPNLRQRVRWIDGFFERMIEAEDDEVLLHSFVQDPVP